MTETCNAPAIFSRWGREDVLPDVYRCDLPTGHAGDHCARHARERVPLRWPARLPVPTPARLRAAELAAAALTPKLEARVLAEEEARHRAWIAANPAAARIARGLGFSHIVTTSGDNS